MSIYTNTTETGDAIFKKITPSSSKNAWNALLYAIGATKNSPFVAGKRVSATLNFPSTGDSGGTSTLTIPCKGAKIGDQCILGTPVPPLASTYTAYVVSADLVEVRLVNAGDITVNPDSAVFTVTVIPS